MSTNTNKDLEFKKSLSKQFKDIHIKGLIQGFEIANQMLYDYCNEHTIEEIKEFTKKNLEKKIEKKLESIIKSSKVGD
jgi:hypothetical protein